jgi:hypothetical protein
MRHPLSNPDIARCVVAEVESNQTLTNIARVSPALSEPALDRLWHTIPSVVLLARTMPGQYWVEEAFKHDQKPNPYDSYWHYARQLVSKNIEIYYARATGWERDSGCTLPECNR